MKETLTGGVSIKIVVSAKYDQAYDISSCYGSQLSFYMNSNLKKKLRRKNKEVFLLHSFKSSHLPHNLLPFMLFKTCRLKYLCHYSHPPFSLCSHPFLLYLNVFKNALKPKKKPSRELCGAVFLQNNIYTYIFMLQNPIVMRSCLPFLNIF